MKGDAGESRDKDDGGKDHIEGVSIVHFLVNEDSQAGYPDHAIEEE